MGLIITAIGVGSVSYSTPAPAEVPASADLSLFDEFVQFSGGVVPFPIARLRDQLPVFADHYSPSPQQSRLRAVALLVPAGRSRQGASTSFADPRIIVATAPSFDEDGSRATFRNFSHRIFVGYSKIADELEVISWNNYRGRFDFQLVSNYTAQGSRVPKTASRVRCLACHQAATPIFPKSPWSESNMNAIAGPFQMSAISVRLANDLHASQYEGIPVDAISEDGVSRQLLAGDLDQMVRAANQLQLSRLIATRACGKSVKCRLAYLVRVIRLARQGFYQASTSSGSAGGGKFEEMTPAGLQLFQAILAATWPAEGLGLIASELSDRDPLVDSTVPEGANPRTPRPIASPIRIAPDLQAARLALTLGFEGLGFFFTDLPTLGVCDDSVLARIVDSREMADLVEQWPLNVEDGAEIHPITLRDRVLGLLGSCAARPTGAQRIFSRI
jgi:hypothetical protein